MSACLRTLFVVIAVLSSMLMPFQSAKASTTGIPCNQTSYLVKTLVLIGLDDLSVPVYTPAATPDGLCLTADFNGDGSQDLLVQGNTASDSTTIYLGDGSNLFSRVHQSWGNGYLGLDWDANSSTIYVGNFDADDKADIILETSGGTSAILYSDASGNFGDVALTWKNIPVSTGSETVVVGTTPGSFNVSNGGANYSIPIEVPPGIAGMAPKLALNYSSQAGNGIAGVGWSLSGLSAVTRCPKTIAQDGVKGGISINNNDRFCLDGQRLVNIIGGYGASGTEYRTEIDSFARVISHGTEGNGPAYFTVETKSGLTMTYGNTANSFVEAQGKSTALFWAVNRIEDKNGNYIDVFYYENSEAGESYPLRIDYTGNGAQKPTRAVAFAYDTARPDGSVGYVAGSKVTKHWRLTNIKTYSDYSSNGIVRDYRLGYEQGSASGRSRLASVQECAGVSCFNPTTFRWQEGNATLDNAITTRTNFYKDFGLAAYKYDLYQGDYNGDGTTDMLFWQKEFGSLSIHPLINGSIQSASNSLGSFRENHDVFPGDYNGDGTTDVLFWESATGRVRLHPIKNGVVQSPTYSVSSFREGYDVIYPGDYNGDGVTDILIWDFDAGKIRVHLVINGVVQGASFSANSYHENFEIHPGDYNGDGISDILFWNKDTGNIRVKLMENGSVKQESFVASSYHEGSELHLGDYNGDGTTDIVFWHKVNGVVRVKLMSNGSVMQESFYASSYHEGSSLQPRDYNGDGITDLLFWNKASGILKIHPIKNGVIQPWIDSRTGFNSGHKVYAGDYLGNGLVDLFFWGSSAGNASLHPLKGPIPDLLTKITDSAGIGTNLAYKPLTDNAVYSTDLSSVSYPTRHFQVPMYVVSVVSSDNGLGGQNRVDYTYKGSKVHVHGRGGLGFSEITAADQVSGVSTITTFNQTFPFIGSATSSTKQLNGINLSNSVVTPQSITLYSATIPDVVFPYADITTETTRDYDTNRDLVRVKTDNNYGAGTYGNLMSVTVTNEELASNGSTNVTVTTTTTNLYGQDDPASWILGRLTDATVVKDRVSVIDPTQNTTSTRRSKFEYDLLTGQLTKEIIEPENGVAGIKVETVHGYDSFGNKILVSKRDPSLVEPDRDTSTIYTADGYFIASVINALGHTETHNYDPRFGARTSLTGPNGLTTSWQHDEFGRRTLETRTDGTTTSTTLRFCQTGEGCDGGHVVVANQSGGAETRAFHDSHGRKIKVEKDGFSGDIYVRETTYDSKERKLGESNNYNKVGGTPLWTCYDYDDLNRVKAVSTPDAVSCNNVPALAKVKEIAYSGFTTTTTLHNAASDGSALPDQTRIETRNGLGKRVSVQDELTLLEYKYDLYGNLTDQTVTPQFTYDATGTKVAATNTTPIITTMEYDQRGRKASMNDPDKGQWSYLYNAFGEMTSQTDANGQTITMAYDELGRIKRRDEVLGVNPDPVNISPDEWLAMNDGTTEWVYDTAVKGIGKLDRTFNNATGYAKSVTYDSFGRPQDVTTQIQFVDYVTSTTYDSYGRIDTVTYPTTPDLLGGTQRFAVKHNYDANGYLTDIRNGATNDLYWEALWVNANGQVTGYNYGNGSTTVNLYDDATGRLESISTSAGTTNLQYLNYQYDRLGNLESRRDDIQNLAETFEYDGLNRLSKATVTVAGGSVDKTYGYDSLGNFLSKSDFAAEYLYGENGAGPHAVTRVNQNAGDVTPKASYSYDANGAMTSGDGRDLLYKSFGKVYAIEKGGNTSTFAYNADQMRIVQTIEGAGAGRTIYLNPGKKNGNKLYEMQEKNNVTTHINYIFAGGSVIGEYRVVDNQSTETRVLSDETRYLYKDHLGSTDLITDDSPSVNVLERMSFDPFGSRRVTTDWSDPIGLLVGQLSTRGFTGHEHMDNLGIIHMNGRVYDPKLGRFLSADPFIQNATSSQAYNRYSYVQNNPMAATDPSGYFLKKFVKKYWRVIVAVVAAVVTGGAALGAMGATWTTASVGQLMIAGMAAGAVSGAITTGSIRGAFEGAIFGAFSAGIAGAIGGTGLGPFGRAMAHGVTRAGLGKAKGGTYRSGFWSGFVGSIAPVDGIKHMEARVLASAVAGGTASVLGGGKFTNGAMSAAFVRLFNHESHMLQKANKWFSKGMSWLKENATSVITTIGGGVQAGLGVAMCTTGVGCVAGAPLMAHGANNIYEGLNPGEDGLLRDGYQSVFGENGGNIAYGVADVGTSVVGAFRAVVKPGTFKLFNNIPDDYVPAYQLSTTSALVGQVGVDVNSINDTYNRVSQ